MEYFLLNISENLKNKGILVISTINRNILSKFVTIYLAENVLRWIPRGTHTYEKYIKILLTSFYVRSFAYICN